MKKSNNEKKQRPKRRPKGKQVNPIPGNSGPRGGGLVEFVPSSMQTVGLTRVVKISEFTEGKKKGIRLQGRYPWAWVGASGAASQNGPCLAPTYLNSTSTFYNTVILHPDYIFDTGTPEKNNCDTMTRYMFKKLNLIYDTQAPTNQSRSVILAFYPDGAAASTGPSLNVSILVTYPGAMPLVTWSVNKSSNVSNQLSTEDCFYVDNDGLVSDVASRQCYQGCVFGIWNNPAGVALTDGLLWIEYDLYLLEPRIAQDVALIAEPLPGHLPPVRFLEQQRKLKAMQLLLDKSHARESELKARDEVSGMVEDHSPQLPVLRRLADRPLAASERSASTDRKSRAK